MCYVIWAQLTLREKLLKGVEQVANLITRGFKRENFSCLVAEGEARESQIIRRTTQALEGVRSNPGGL